MSGVLRALRQAASGYSSRWMLRHKLAAITPPEYRKADTSINPLAFTSSAIAWAKLIGSIRKAEKIGVSPIPKRIRVLPALRTSFSHWPNSRERSFDRRTKYRPVAATIATTRMYASRVVSDGILIPPGNG